MELNRLERVPAALELHDQDCQTCSPGDHFEELTPINPKQDIYIITVEDQCNKNIDNSLPTTSLKIKIPSDHKDVSNAIETEDSNDGFKTPTSRDQRIPLKLECPPAPRKPKSTPSKKRKSCSSALPTLHLISNPKYIHSLFPSSIKKLKQPNCSLSPFR